MEKKTDSNYSSGLQEWDLDAVGCLTISGTGKLPDYNREMNPATPWNDRKDEIREIRIGEGVTEIGMRTFEGCTGLETVYLPASLKRIHAYAFRNCVSLGNIISEKQDFRYVYDPEAGDEKDEILFGIGSFFNTPWATEKWGGFYVRNKTLYACFLEDRNLVLPEGITSLHRFSLKDLEISTITFPKSLKVIDDFAFSGSRIQEMILPSTLETIGDYAFGSARIYILGYPWKMKYLTGFTHIIEILEEEERKQNIKTSLGKELFRSSNPVWSSRAGSGLKDEKASKSKKKKTKRIKLTDIYTVKRCSNKAYGPFDRLKVERKKPVTHKDGSVSFVVGRNTVDVGKSLYRRLMMGSVLLSIRWENNRVINVKSFCGYKTGTINEYLMYPYLDQKDGVSIWTDSFTEQEKEDMENAFWDGDGSSLEEADVLRYTPESTHEEWYLASDDSDFGGPMELQLLEMWLQEHPEVTLDSVDEAREKGKYRWFVDI